MVEERPLHAIYVEFLGKFRADLADDLNIGQTFAAKVNAIKELSVDIAVQLLLGRRSQNTHNALKTSVPISPYRKTGP